MTIREVPNELNRAGRNIVNDNFKQFSTIESNAIKAMLERNPGNLTPDVNGLLRSEYLVDDMRTMPRYGIQFVAKVNGVISGAWVYASNAGSMIVGLAYKKNRELETGTVGEKVVNLVKGWNHVEMAFPIEQDEHYILYKRFSSTSISTATRIISGWNKYDFHGNALKLINASILGSTSGYSNYNTFFEIEVITSLAQIFWLMNTSVRPTHDIYVGENPPVDAKFWFRPIGG